MVYITSLIPYLNPNIKNNRNIGIFSGNETRMDVYFMGTRRDLRMRKVIQANILSAEFVDIPTNNKFDKAVRYIHNNRKIPILNQMISSHRMIYNIFDSGIYHKPYSIFKSKSQEFHKINIGIFSGNETKMAGYFMGIHRDLWMRKVIQ